jgi:hypothetical protein
MRCLSIAWVPLVAVLAATPPPALAAQTAPASAPATPFQQPGERVEPSGTTELEVLATVLTFFNPPGGQARWLEAERLPATEGAAATRVDAGTIAALIARLGAGPYCAGDARNVCRSSDGGALRVSPVYRPDDAHARVAVRFTSHWFAAPAVTTTQVFTLERRGGVWRVVGRSGAADLP